MGTVAERCWEAVESTFAGRRVILAGMPVAGATGFVAALRRVGAGRVLVVGSGVGTGPLPDPDDAEWVVVEAAAPDPVAEFRLIERILADPPATVRDAVAAFDPGREAVLLMAPFQAITALDGRPVFGARRPEWVALEDKSTNDAFFDAAGVARPPSEVVAVDGAALLAAHGRLDAGAGTVWAGDARDGFNGGGVFVRRVRAGAPTEDVDEAVAFFGPRCDRVRVAPFLEGIPCSVHGIVTDDGLAVLRPVEMVTLRQTGTNRLRYAGTATYWDPPPADREAMRAAARRTGRLLAERVAYRGTFGIDGVLTADGWLPTELNPRFGAGVGQLARAAETLPFVLLHFLAVETGRLPVAVDELERVLVDAADANRGGGGWLTVERQWHETEEHEVPGGTLVVGPSAVGGFVRFTPSPGTVEVGASVAPAVVVAFAHADRELGTGIGPLEPAPDLRRPAPGVSRR
jgi:hypothetical protein